MTRVLTLSLLALLTACGGKSYCERIASDAEDCGETVTDSQLEECEVAMESCTNSDNKLLNEFWDCASDAGLSVCETTDSTSTSTGTGFEDFAALMACIGPLNDLSPECAADFNSMTTTSSSTFTTTTTSSR